MDSATEKKGRGIQQRVSYAVGHRVRIEILAALHERAYSAAGLAQITHQPLSTVTHHVEELLKDGSIEVAKTERVRNITQSFYRAVRRAYVTNAEHAELAGSVKQETFGVILQAIMVESMASFWSGCMIEDDQVWLGWNWFNVDQEGREEIAAIQEEAWAQIQQVEVRAGERRTKSGEEARSIVVASLGFPRIRNTPQPPFAPDAPDD